MLAFENIGDDVVFIGAVSAPMPVRWEAGRLVVATAEPCAEDEQVVRAVTAMSGPTHWDGTGHWCGARLG